MLRAVLRTRPSVSRSFVSTVLLTRTYENESVANLKKLAKERGLSQKGNKSTLITRIQQNEKDKTLEAVSSAQRDPPVPTAAKVRQASTAATTPTAGIDTAGSEASSPVPGIPPDALPEHRLSSTAFTNISLPDLSQPIPESPTPIPFAPDHYNSINEPTPYEAVGATPIEPVIPQVLVVAGAATHHGGGPSHSLHDGNESSDRHEHAQRSEVASESKPTTPGGIWRDLADDIGLPTELRARKLTEGQQAAFDSLIETTNTTHDEKSHSRNLDKEEQRGVWLLLGLLGGSWLLGGVNSASKEPEDGH
jgi:hypothetical protein